MSVAGVPQFTEAERTTLVEFLESDRHQGLGYPETAGFLFALICAPRMVMPSDWIGGVLGNETELANQEEANRILGALMSLNNWIATQRENGESPVPPGVALRPEPMENFESDFSRWSQGFLNGHDWVAEDWDLYASDDAESGLALATLGFFSSRKFADAFCTEALNKPVPLEDFAETVCRLMPEAFTIYARAGRTAQQRIHQPAQQPAQSEKIGRNDPCPCGSGKKYKKCCLPNEQQRHERRPPPSHAGPDFQGLSPDQMHKLLYHPFESPELVRFADRLETDPEAPVLGLFQRLVQGIGEKGLKATAKGNLPREFCRQAARDAGMIGRETWWLEPERLRSETDYMDLHVTRLIAGLAGLIRKYKGRLVLTKKARKMLDQTGLREIYPLLLKTYVTKFNWAYRDRAEELPIVQHSFAYTLYLLDRLGTQWQPHHVYEEAFVKAFPRTLTEVPDLDWFPAERTVRNCYRWRTLQNFLDFFGLADVQALTDDIIDREYRIRCRPLLRDCVQFTAESSKHRHGPLH